MNRESSVAIQITVCKIHSTAGGNLLSVQGAQPGCSMTAERGAAVEREAHEEGTMYICAYTHTHTHTLHTHTCG